LIFLCSVPPESSRPNWQAEPTQKAFLKSKFITDKMDLGMLYRGFHPRIRVHPRSHLHLVQVQVSVVKNEFQNAVLGICASRSIIAATDGRAIPAA
jgi:hypothetical protein